jgi:hypothetical protein
MDGQRGSEQLLRHGVASASEVAAGEHLGVTDRAKHAAGGSGKCAG